MANLIEEVVKIRQILENGSGGSDGGANLKTLNIINNTTADLFFYNVIVDGYWNEMPVTAGGTAAVQYVAPAAEGSDGPIPFVIGIDGVLGNVTATTPEGITYMSNANKLYMVASAADGATVTFISGQAGAE